MDTSIENFILGEDEIKLKRKTDKKIKKHPPVRAWEEMFFW